jgi:hypothetical protein
VTAAANAQRRLAGEAAAALGLEPRLLRLIAAVHEAGHAIAGATVGFDITAARAGTIEAADANRVTADFGAGRDVPLSSLLTWKAAGYQASFTWLQGRGIDGAQPPYDFALNTLAADDINSSLAACRRLGMPHLTMQHGIEGAAWILTHRWRAVLRLTYALTRRGHLAGGDLVPYLADDFPQYREAIRAHESWRQRTAHLWLRQAAPSPVAEYQDHAGGEKP